MAVKAGSGRGTCVHAAGYIQVTRRGPFRGWLEHRMVMYLAMKNGLSYYPVNGNLPEGFTVEHLDHNRQHNCMCNLMLLDKRIHDHLSSTHAKTVQELRSSVFEVPAWVNTDY